MYLCIRNLLALLVTMFSPVPLSIPMSTFCSAPSFSTEYTDDVPIDNFEICDSNVDLSDENDVLNVLGGYVETFESLGYLSGYDVALDSYCLYLVDKPRKIMWSNFVDFSFDFSMT